MEISCIGLLQFFMYIKSRLVNLDPILSFPPDMPFGSNDYCHSKLGKPALIDISSLYVYVVIKKKKLSSLYNKFPLTQILLFPSTSMSVISKLSVHQCPLMILFFFK
ncbi:hypothetical protein SAY86_020345 [Trapa natans]|uniref:Uncharacterized protein n=1 Tax=Trapa natans TaxID=22666 RepID=A0AAN7LMG9_TRANT|nr:hypothetical protein SAY86_020345 [Trapa natans]